MAIIEKTVIEYFASDGKCFRDLHEAKSYEAELELTRKLHSFFFV